MIFYYKKIVFALKSNICTFVLSALQGCNGHTEARSLFYNRLFSLK